jgi:hypothetical protein
LEQTIAEDPHIGTNILKESEITQKLHNALGWLAGWLATSLTMLPTILDLVHLFAMFMTI